jgi:hypothetical protein
MFLSATELRYQRKKPSDGQVPPKAKNLLWEGVSGGTQVFSQQYEPTLQFFPFGDLFF